MHRLLLLVPLIACGGPETNIRTLTPELVVVPEEAAFGEVAALTSADINLAIVNDGKRELNATFTIEGADAAVFTIPVDAVDVALDTTFDLPVTFAPPTFLAYEATLVIDSNDEDEPRKEIPLTGTGVFAPMPDVCINPQVMDWGPVMSGTSVPMVLAIENCGTADLALGVMTQVGSGAFRVDPNSDPSNATVSPGETQPVFVYYEPTNDAGDNGELLIPANDPDMPEISVTMLGNGGGTFDYPVALIDCPLTAAPPEVVVLDGTGSYDPAGLTPLSYQWNLVNQPNGSTAELSDYIGSSTSFLADLGGQFEVQLQVGNTAGVWSAPERCFIDAVPADDIHVELTWDTTSVDLDLHLMQNTSASIYDVPEDCNWCNQNPDWGNAGANDDPRLDLDDQSDGPENINILAPVDGAYPVAVHYYDPLGGPTTTATVAVFTNGVEVYRDSKVMTRNQVWSVGQVNWPAGTFGVYADPLFNATRRQCP